MTLRRFESFSEASRTVAKRGLCIALVECVLTLVSSERHNSPGQVEPRRVRPLPQR